MDQIDSTPRDDFPLPSTTHTEALEAPNEGNKPLSHQLRSKPKQEPDTLTLSRSPPLFVRNIPQYKKPRRRRQKYKYKTYYLPQEMLFPLTRLPPELIRLVLDHIYINICEEDDQTFGCARLTCDEFSDSALREYGPVVGMIWSEPYWTLEGAMRAMTRLMEKTPKNLALYGTWGCGYDDDAWDFNP